MPTVCTMIGARRGITAPALRAALVAAAALLTCACNTTQQVAGVPEEPTDYRMRHPIVIREADRTLQMFIGSNRSELTPSQRAELLAFAQSWRREATGGVVIDLPVGASNERAAADALREVQSIIVASGVAPQAMVVRNYRPGDRTLGPIRITYPKIAAQAGPCGVWPEDIGPSFNRNYFENQPMHYIGCASQRNLAAMIDNPADLVQPRAETPAYTMRRTTVVEKYRQGVSPATTSDQSSSAGKISELGK
jgi:pilus assembly protein CpaD